MSHKEFMMLNYDLNVCSPTPGFASIDRLFIECSRVAIRLHRKTSCPSFRVGYLPHVLHVWFMTISMPSQQAQTAIKTEIDRKFRLVHCHHVAISFWGRDRASGGTCRASPPAPR